MCGHLSDASILKPIVNRLKAEAVPTPVPEEDKGKAGRSRSAYLRRQFEEAKARNEAINNVSYSHDPDDYSDDGGYDDGDGPPPLVCESSDDEDWGV